MRIEEHLGDRGAVRALFELAEDSAEQLDGYLDLGRVLVALDGTRAIGEAQLIDLGSGDVELKSLAVAESHQRAGVGRALIGAVIALARSERATRLLVSTATASIGNLRFYQRVGFRMAAIDRDAFTPETGYPDEIRIDGIVLRDRIWFDLPLIADLDAHEE